MVLQPAGYSSRQSLGVCSAAHWGCGKGKAAKKAEEIITAKRQIK